MEACDLSVERQREIISICVADGDWSVWGSVITRDMMMDYLLYMTNPEITGGGMKTKDLPKVDCMLCGAPIKPQKFSLTIRAVYYLMCAQFLSKESLAKGGDGYVHYAAINDKLQGNFRHQKGTKFGSGYVFSSYSILTKSPWDFISPRVDSEYKPKRDGYFIPTDKCLDFLRGKIAVPVRIERLDSEVVRYSRELVYAAKVKDINWQQALEIYKTF